MHLAFTCLIIIPILWHTRLTAVISLYEEMLPRFGRAEIIIKKGRAEIITQSKRKIYGRRHMIFIPPLNNFCSSDFIVKMGSLGHILIKKNARDCHLEHPEKGVERQ